MKFASFDLEIAKDLKDDIDNWTSHAPLGITCAAVALSDTEEITYWKGYPQLSKMDCQKLVNDLQSLHSKGYVPLTWNGTAFDFHVLALETDMYEECGELALNHYDMMLWVTFIKGFYLGLQKALSGANLEGKLKHITLSDGSELHDMDGSKAPVLWSQGEFEAVLDYLREDVLQPLKLVKDIQRTGSIRWTSNNGKPQSVIINKLHTVGQCFSIPQPDVSWMTAPPSRDQFVSWIPDVQTKIAKLKGR